MKIKSIKHKYYKDPIPVYDVINAEPNHNFVIVGKTSNFVAHNCVIFDEVNFSQAGIKDIEKSKERMKAKYDTLVARVTGTFVKQGEVFGKLYVISSKNSDSDFMEEYIQKQKEAGNKHMYIFDEPQWKVWPKSKYSSDKMFHIAIGGKKLSSFVVPDNTSEEGLAELKAQGYQLMEVPEDNKTRFLSDFDIALRDIAGVSVPGTLSYITQDIIDGCIGSRKNPFFNDILEIGTKSNFSIEEFFHSEVVDQKIKQAPLFIHIDLSLNTDLTGISGVAITGRKDIKSGDKTISVPSFTHVFSVALQAPRGDKIPYDKITAFIVWLRSQKFNIESITRDQFQSEYMGQLLEAQGFGEVRKLSLDRTPDGYMTLRSVLLEKRIDMLDCQKLQDELIHIQRDATTGKLDHPMGGCFTSDTRISLVDGRDLTIFELLLEQTYKNNWVYTINEATLDLEAKRILHVHPTKWVDILVKVTLDTGEYIKCTPDHLFMLPDGSYMPAKSLPIGITLMSLDTILKNHKIVNIEFIQESCLVYDLTIECNPNFALSAGVFVHNSKDVSDSFAGAVWNAVLTSPATPVPTKTVINAMKAVNGPRRNPQSDLSSIFVDRRYKKR